MKHSIAAEVVERYMFECAGVDRTEGEGWLVEDALLAGTALDEEKVCRRGFGYPDTASYTIHAVELIVSQRDCSSFTMQPVWHRARLAF